MSKAFLGTFGALCGFAAALFLLFFSESLQNAIEWRREKWLGQVPARQIYLEKANFAQWRRSIRLLQPGTVVLLGDSHFQGLAPKLLGPEVINLAVGGLSASRMVRYLRSGDLELPRQPQSIVLLVGRNDLEEGLPLETVERNFVSLIRFLAEHKSLVFVEIPPLTRQTSAKDDLVKVNHMNLFLRRQCATESKCRWIALGALRNRDGFLSDEFDSGDGIHLNPRGYEVLIREIKGTLNGID